MTVSWSRCHFVSVSSLRRGDGRWQGGWSGAGRIPRASTSRSTLRGLAQAVSTRCGSAGSGRPITSDFAGLPRPGSAAAAVSVGLHHVSGYWPGRVRRSADGPPNAAVQPLRVKRRLLARALDFSLTPCTSMATTSTGTCGRSRAALRRASRPRLGDRPGVLRPERGGHGDFQRADPQERLRTSIADTVRRGLALHTGFLRTG